MSVFTTSGGITRKGIEGDSLPGNGMKQELKFMRIRTGALLLAFMTLPVGAHAQDKAQKVREALPPEVATEVETIARAASEAGIPTGPLYDKALEGAAKRVPSARIVPAISAYADRLLAARQALGVRNEPWIVAGADAISRGVSTDALARMAPGDQGPRGPMSVVVLGNLVESGVPADRALEVVMEAVRTDQGEADMVAISGTVDRMIRDGNTPHDAAGRLVRHMRRGLAVRRLHRDMPRDLVRDRPGPPVAPGVETVDKKPVGG